MRCPPAPGSLPRAEKQLRPRPNAPREEVAASQRERLQAAMIEAVGERGYERASVDEIVALAGVSTKALYRQFGSKLDCFLATYDLLLDVGAARVAAAARAGDERERGSRLERALAELLALRSTKRQAARLALLEVLVVGPRALQHVQRGEDLFGAMLTRGLETPDESGAASAAPTQLPAPIARALVHGLWRAQRVRMSEAGEGERGGDAEGETNAEGRAIAEGGADAEGRVIAEGRADAAALARWLQGYRDPRVARLSWSATDGEKPADEGEPDAIDGKKPTDEGERDLVQALARERDPRRRSLLAAAQIVTEGGYAALSIPAVCRRGRIELSTLLELYGDAEACYLATFEMLSVSLLARGLRDAEGAAGFAAGACALTRSVLDEIARRPQYAAVCFVEIFAAGAAGAERREALLHRFAQLLLRRAPADAGLTPLLAEAIVGAVWGVIHRSAVRGEVEELPTLAGEVAYLLLAPIVGAEEALAAIVG